jgi:hypothetical protein
MFVQHPGYPQVSQDKFRREQNRPAGFQAGTYFSSHSYEIRRRENEILWNHLPCLEIVA